MHLDAPFSVGELRTTLFGHNDTPESTKGCILVEHNTDLRIKLALSLTLASGAVAPPASYSSGQGTK